MSDFKSAETQFKPKPIDLFKNAVSFALTHYHLRCWLTYLKCQNCITFKSVYKLNCMKT